MTIAPTEEQEQRMLVQYLRLHGYTLHHSPNETGHTPEARRRAGRMKAAGTSKGFPDLLIFKGSDRWAVELKRTVGGRATPEQKEWLHVLAAHGFKSAICHGYKEAIDFIENKA